jgi:hypothetical protein
MRIGALIVLSLSLTGCAAVFRGSKGHVRIESTPPTAQAAIDDHTLGPTPAEIEVKRKGSTHVSLTKAGFEEHKGAIRKHMNVPWLLLDLGTCIFTFCIPLVIDAVSGAWYDVDRIYIAELKPALPGAASSTPAQSTSSPTAATPAPSMSESERKATARAAYQEGVKLQDDGKCPEALPRFEAAQKLFSAPTHLLHIAQCQAATGKLVEASETYETLVRTPASKDAEAFRAAIDEGKAELTALRPRIPTLRITVIPALTTVANAVVKSNGVQVPLEVVGIARPVNPGHYTVTVWAPGFKEARGEVDVGESTPKAIELRLTK